MPLTHLNKINETELESKGNPGPGQYSIPIDKKKNFNSVIFVTNP